MKILHVIADLDPSKGGPPAVCRGEARLMAGRGHQVRIITTDRGFVAVDSDQVENLEIEALPASPPAFFGASRAMRHRLREIIPEIDVVHVHALYLFHDWTAGRFCRQSGKPYIVQPHGILDPYIRRQHRWRKSLIELAFQNAVLRDAAGLHYTMQEEWELARPFARNPRGCVVHIGIDVNDYRPVPRSALRARYPELGDRKVVLFFGRLSKKKGLDLLIDAFAAVAEVRQDLFLVIAGPDEGIKARLVEQIARRGVTERCLFTGMVSGEAKRELLYGSNFFVLPSFSENFAVTVVEAAICGLPIIMSNRINLWHEFEAANAACIVPPVADAVARSLAQLIDNPAAAAAMAARSGALARRCFTWDALGDRYEQMYATAAQTGRLPLPNEPWPESLLRRENSAFSMG